MEDPKWLNWAKLIDLSKQSPSWWDRNKARLALGVSFLSLAIAALSAWYARKAITAEHRPLLELVSGDASDHKTVRLLIKNSGRSTAVNIRAEYLVDIGTRPLRPDFKRLAFTLRKSVGAMGGHYADVVSGGSLEFPIIISPGVEWLKIYDGLKQDDNIRLHGNLRYEDYSRNQFLLPICFEFESPGADVPLGAMPCNLIDHP